VRFGARVGSVLRNADRVLAPSETARALVGKVVDRSITFVGDHANKRARRVRLPEGAAAYCGIIPVGLTARELDLVRRIARRLKQVAPDMFLIVLGTTLDEHGLMGSGNTFVSGAIEPDGYEVAFRRYGLAKLFVPALHAVFGHPAMAAAEGSDLPLAAFDWSNGGWTPRPQDLSINPALNDAEIADALGTWFTPRSKH
jgi:hypothetical protein